jgi:hypothetical protein
MSNFMPHPSTNAESYPSSKAALIANNLYSMTATIEQNDISYPSGCFYRVIATERKAAAIA